MSGNYSRLIYTEFIRGGNDCIWGRKLSQVPSRGETIAIWHQSSSAWIRYEILNVVWMMKESQHTSAKVYVKEI